MQRRSWTMTIDGHDILRWMWAIVGTLITAGLLAASGFAGLAILAPAVVGTVVSIRNARFERQLRREMRSWLNG